MSAVRGVAVTIIVLTLGRAGVAAASVELLAPTPFAAVSSDHISVVVQSDCSTLSLSLRDDEVALRPVAKGIYHGRIPLSFGFNEIYISSAEGDSLWVALVRLPLMAIVRRSRVRYPRYRFHTSDLGKSCIGCHVLDRYTEVTSNSETACLSCHPADEEWVQPHRPAERGACHLCHGEGPIPEAMPSSQRGLCQSCHKDKIEEFSREYVHGPVAAGSCTACHNPHGSSEPHGLRLPVGQLCTSCHEALERDVMGKVLHDPFERGDCTACHDPHSTSYAWGLARRSNESCAPCHSLEDAGDWHMHPVAGKPKTRVEPVKLTDRGELECVSCHDPHFSGLPHLLRTGSGQKCRGCHADK